jgi:two-component system OmpR family response regulator
MSKQVLIVDDNPANRKLLYFALRRGDYEMHEAATGGELMTLTESISPDLALLDIELPDEDGLSLAGKLRQKYPKAILVMLSVNDEQSIVDRAFYAGANAYVVKPYDLCQVVDLIQLLVGAPDDSRSGMLFLPNNASISSYRPPETTKIIQEGVPHEEKKS